jgi:hypothetical protein
MEEIVRLVFGLAFGAVCLAFGAFCVWVSIRIVNRRFAGDIRVLHRWLASNNLTKTHAIVIASMLALFMVLTFQATGGLNNGPQSGVYAVEATVGTITGPLTGAISRGFQFGSLRTPLSLMAYCVPVLLIGLVMQFIRLPEGKLTRYLRMAFWIFGWSVWFLGGLISVIDALF